MPALFRRWPHLDGVWSHIPFRLPGRGGPQRPSGTDHGHAPYAAWEAELAAYARLRTGTPIKVTFGMSTEAGWGETIHLARPDGHLPLADAFASVERQLEHLVMHHRHGWRELALLWHSWARSGDVVVLPWAPWDHAPLPAQVIRLALAEVQPAMDLEGVIAGWPPRLRDAARWLASAWADGAHRALEVAERPGLAERLPLPAPAKPGTWERVLLFLALGGDADESLLPPGEKVRDALRALAAVEAGDLKAHVAGVVDAVRALAAAGTIPPSHVQRPPWLGPGWGRWRREAALRQALDHIARSPATAALAAATAGGRSRGPSLGGAGRLGLGHGAPREAPAADQAPAATAQPPDGVGAPWDAASSATPAATAPTAEATTVLGEGDHGESHARGLAGSGSSSGVLGALHVVKPAASDREAYWQLRGALAPEIEALIERLRAASDDYYECVPHRFQRSGRLDHNRLPAAVAGRETVFARFVHEPAPAHALCLLLDCSASMTARAEQLREAAILVESAAAAVGARVTAFTFGADWERLEPASEGAPLVALGRELRPHGGTPFAPAVAAAAEWLAHQPYETKRLWVFSDGQWTARDRFVASWRPEHLRSLVVWVLGDETPEPPTPAMRVVAVGSHADLVHRAPAYFWGPQGSPSSSRAGHLAVAGFGTPNT
jgi:hypothetical protein